MRGEGCGGGAQSDRWSVSCESPILCLLHAGALASLPRTGPRKEARPTQAAHSVPLETKAVCSPSVGCTLTWR